MPQGNPNSTCPDPPDAGRGEAEASVNSAEFRANSTPSEPDFRDPAGARADFSDGRSAAFGLQGASVGHEPGLGNATERIELDHQPLRIDGEKRVALLTEHIDHVVLAEVRRDIRRSDQ